jgi:hypothetical protein
MEGYVTRAGSVEIGNPFTDKAESPEGLGR